MSTQLVKETEGDERTQKNTVRVAVAGATGFAGQELIRLLARHPHAVITVATGSQATSTPRRLPALSKIWDGTVVPLDTAAIDADVVFLALPEAASAEVAPALVASGKRVIDLSGAFRLRDAASRAKWYPATASLPDGVAYGLTEFELEAIGKAGAIRVPVYICLGERDVSPRPYDEPRCYHSSKDVTLHILPQSGHCQTFASTRMQMVNRIDGWIRSLPAVQG